MRYTREMRLHQRYPSQVMASVSTAAGDYLSCIIRNYCNGGLFIELMADNHPWSGQPGDAVRRGELIEVEFRPPSESQGAVRARTRVVRVEGTGIGLSFLGPEADSAQAVDALRRHAEDARVSVTPRPTHATRRDRDRLRRLLDKFLDQFRDALAERAPAIFRRAERELFDAWAREPNSGLGERYHRARAVVRAQSLQIETDWLRALGERVKGLAQSATQTWGKDFTDASGYAELELVDEASFEQWVVVSGRIAKAQAQLQAPLYELEQRLSCLSDSPLEKDKNPIGPASVFWSLKQAMDPYGFEIEAERTLLTGAADAVTDLLKEIYGRLNAELTAEGILPDVKPRRVVTAGDQGPIRNPRKAPPHRERRETTIQMLQNVLEAGSAGGHRTRAPRPRGGQTVDLGQVLQALSDLQPTRNRPLPVEVQSALSAHAAPDQRPSVLSEEVERALSVTERLIELFRADESVGCSILTPSFERMEVPLAKVAIEHPNFLGDPQHPAVQVVNELGRLALSLSSDRGDAQYSSAITDFLQHVAEELARDGGPAVAAFDRAKGAIAPYVAEYNDLFERNLLRVREGCEGKERLRQARRTVRRMLEKAAPPGPVPRVANELLSLGWTSAMILKRLDRSLGSDALSEYAETFKTLIGLLSGPATEGSAPPPDSCIQVVGRIRRGLSEVPFDSIRQRALIDLLEKAFSGSSETLRRIALDRVPLSISVDDTDPGAARTLVLDAEQVGALEAWAPLIGTISPGDWLVERRSEGPPRSVCVGCKSADGEWFAFVDGRGFKAFERDLPGFAKDLETGRLSHVEDGRLPLVGRSIQRALRGTYDRVIHQSAHDSLTGLINRRQFEASLERAVQQAQSGLGRYVLLILDIDRFKVVNDVCGHEGGDQLLKEAAHLIASHLPEGASLGRTGDDEFGILLHDCTRDAGYGIAEAQRRAIESMGLRWKDRKFSTSASIGLVAIDARCPSASRALMQADSACFLAKEAGRNLTKVFEASDTEVTRHQRTLQSLPFVEEVIEKGRIALYLQLIEPVFLEEGMHDHYEVLLRILDAEQNPISPDELIRAAERFDRMRALDRWVIEHLFRWLADNAARLSDVGGFSINLSGQSLGDSAMLDLIVERLSVTEFPRDRIAFEITETTMVKDFTAAEAFVNRIKQVGCKLYLDDFGTGMSSYAYLKSFPVDCVKIDGTFIRNVDKDEKDRALVRSITDICHFNDRLVIAEFVETEGILDRLREIGVDFAQGYALGRPFPLTELLRDAAAAS